MPYLKITRDAFLYLESPLTPAPADFAQCSDCAMFIPASERCSIHGPDVLILATDSCGLFVEGDPLVDITVVAETAALVTPEQSGLVHRQVRCENCRYFDAENDECGLYRDLNAALPDMFDLDISVQPRACCNAQMPAGAAGWVPVGK